MLATDLGGQLQQHYELYKRLKDPPAQELVCESTKPQKSPQELAIEKGRAVESALAQAYEMRQKENELKKQKQLDMSTKNEMLSQIKKNASDISSKSEILKKKMNENKKDITPTKNDIIAKKFSENKSPNPTKKEVLEKKAEAFAVNKKDILGDKGPDKKNPDKNGTDKTKTELKPNKPKPR